MHDPRKLTLPDRPMTDEEVAVMAAARFRVMNALMPSRQCNCPRVEVAVYVCPQHWNVSGVVVNHVGGCASTN